MSKKTLIILGSIIIALGGMVAYIGFQRSSNTIKELKLYFPKEIPVYGMVEVHLAKPAPVYVDYTEVATGKKFRTTTSPADTLHQICLMLLKADCEYTYQVVLDETFAHKTPALSFRTEKYPNYMQNHWFNESHPHDTTALGDGLIMTCNGRLPGNITMIDAEGNIRWRFQLNDIGIRHATLTPRGTILALLRPQIKDEVDDRPLTAEEAHAEEHKKPLRRGAIGFAGGTGLAEIDLQGNLLWRLDLNKVMEDKELQVIHHDAHMDKDGHIFTLYRPKTVATFKEDGKTVTDTISGDGILELDSLGNVLSKWSAWEHWDIEKDTMLSEYKYDRFHINGMCMDQKGNFLLSAPIEDQIWKVNRQTGEIEWRMGRNGDFQMNEEDYFSFQHTPYIMENGDLMLFDNGLWNEISGAKAFRLDEENKTAQTTIKAMLPAANYTARMGSAYLLPNGNLLQCSSKTGSVLITDLQGNILWQAVMYWAPYRATYVPIDSFSKYFKAQN